MCVHYFSRENVFAHPNDFMIYSNYEWEEYFYFYIVRVIDLKGNWEKQMQRS